MERCQSRPNTMLAAWALLLALQVGPWWYSSIDAASYVSMARSLTHGGGPTNLGSPLLWYSPGYPALIAPFFLLADRPFAAISLFQWLLATAMMLGVYRWAKGVAPEAAIWVASLTVVNHGFWIHFRRPLSEMAFLCALAWAVNCLRGLSGASRPAAFIARGALSAGLAALLCIIRPVGVMLVPSFAVWAWFETAAGRMSGRRAAAAAVVVAAAAAAPVALFMAHERTVAAEIGGRSYVDNFNDAAQSPLASYSRGVQLCISDVGRVCIPGLFKSHGAPGEWIDVNMLIHVPFFVLVCFGWWRWTRRDNDVWAWYVPFYLLLIAAHAMDTGARLMLPLLPALFVCAWFAAERIGARRQIVAAACLALQLLVAGGYWLGVDLPRARHYDRQWPSLDKLAARIAAEPAPVSAWRLSGELLLRLELSLDRPVMADGERDDNVGWLVAPADQQAPAGFVRYGAAGELALWRKQDSRRPRAK